MSLFAFGRKQYHNLFLSLDLTIHHIIPITNFYNVEFTRHHSWKKGTPAYQTTRDTMVELGIVVIEKFVKELEGQKSAIHNDGWTKNQHHYLECLATYPVNSDKKTKKGEPIMESVKSALASPPF